MSDELQLAALHLRISGRVHGVGFRESMRDVALTLNIVGWVRNCSDGSVETLIQGEVAALEQMIVWVHRGPPGSRVIAVAAHEASVDKDLITFVRHPTY